MVPVALVPPAEAEALSTAPSTAVSTATYAESVWPLPFAAGTGTLNAPVTDADAPGASVASDGVLPELNSGGAAFCGGWGVTLRPGSRAHGPPAEAGAAQPA